MVASKHPTLSDIIDTYVDSLVHSYWTGYNAPKYSIRSSGIVSPIETHNTWVSVTIKAVSSTFYSNFGSTGKVPLSHIIRRRSISIFTTPRLTSSTKKCLSSFANICYWYYAVVAIHSTMEEKFNSCKWDNNCSLTKIGLYLWLTIPWGTEVVAVIVLFGPI